MACQVEHMGKAAHMRWQQLWLLHCCAHISSIVSDDGDWLGATLHTPFLNGSIQDFGNVCSCMALSYHPRLQNKIVHFPVRVDDMGSYSDVALSGPGCPVVSV